MYKNNKVKYLYLNIYVEAFRYRDEFLHRLGTYVGSTYENQNTRDIDKLLAKENFRPNKHHKSKPVFQFVTAISPDLPLSQCETHFLQWIEKVKLPSLIQSNPHLSNLLFSYNKHLPSLDEPIQPDFDYSEIRNLISNEANESIDDLVNLFYKNYYDFLGIEDILMELLAEECFLLEERREDVYAN